ncbi:unnamed protein product [Adineta steineri]|uniref:Serpentine receptor class gamma n=1 Tax=Adineta steineri TaxID=433720 RepID=A0A819NZF6_9BILA|nr:unnamed protein product [Adineta steineri]
MALLDGVLILRVIIQKRRLQQTPGWRKYRKLIIQYILVNGTYLIFNMPSTLVHLVQQFGMNKWGNDIVSAYFNPMTDIPSMIVTYAVLVTMPNLKQKLRALIICKRNQQTIARA